MREYNVEQGTYEWHELRLNRITSSRVADIFKKDNLSLIDEMIAERVLMEVPEDGYVSEAMQWGKEHEDEAAQEWAKRTGCVAEQVGFCTNDIYDYIAMSPDRLTPDRTGGCEIKCPNTATHVQFIRMGIIPAKHIRQVEQYFLVNEKQEWLDFVSFDPRFTPKPYHAVRVERNAFVLENTMNELVKFWDKLDKYYQQVTF